MIKLEKTQMIGKDRFQFPLNLDSNNGKQPQQQIQIKFQNYYPKSQQLQQSSIIIPSNNQSAQIIEQIQNKMKQMNIQNLIQNNKINIYPKKNTIDLKKHFLKKTHKIQKKTQKAIILFAQQIMKNKIKQFSNNHKQ